MRPPRSLAAAAVVAGRVVKRLDTSRGSGSQLAAVSGLSPSAQVRLVAQDRRPVLVDAVARAR